MPHRHRNRLTIRRAMGLIAATGVVLGLLNSRQPRRRSGRRRGRPNRLAGGRCPRALCDRGQPPRRPQRRTVSAGRPGSGRFPRTRLTFALQWTRPAAGSCRFSVPLLLIRPRNDDLPAAAAKTLRNIRIEGDELARLQDLLVRNQDDELNPAEKADVESYLRVSWLIREFENPPVRSAPPQLHSFPLIGRLALLRCELLAIAPISG